MKRVYTKKGDVFAVKIGDDSKKYFQYIANDMTQLNSDVIRAFKTKYPIDAQPDIKEITNGEVEFYAHCIVNLGVRLGYWEKVGHVPFEGKIDVLFRDSVDYGVGEDEETVKNSKRWFIWNINDEDFTKVGKLKGKNRKAEIGVVVRPQDIIDRMTTGEYNFVYPGFE